jgi:hypothetical protein
LKSKQGILHHWCKASYTASEKCVENYGDWKNSLLITKYVSITHVKFIVIAITFSEKK